MPARTTLNRASAMVGQPPAPAGFDKDERELWKAIVESRPAPTWTASDLMWLRLYVLPASDIEQLDGVIARTGNVVDGKVNPSVKVRAMREQFLLAVGMRLKLMPSNRWDPKAIHRLGQHANKGRAAPATMDADKDDLLSGMPSRKGRLQ